MRQAWLAQYLPRFPGSGVVYCLTVADTEQVAAWLTSRGITAAAYHAGDDGGVERVALEQAWCILSCSRVRLPEEAQRDLDRRCSSHVVAVFSPGPAAAI